MKAWVFLWALLCAAVCQAASWTICDFTVQVSAVSDKGVRATIEKAAARNAAVCAAPGTEVSFLPERPDYQEHFSRKQWPKKYQRVPLRFRTLNGDCKNDGGGSTPCTITHWSIMDER